jgi:hypothetical protein
MATDEQSSPEKQIALPALVESLLFVADEPVTVARLAQALEVDTDAVEVALKEISADGANRGVRLQRKGDRVQLVDRKRPCTSSDSWGWSWPGGFHRLRWKRCLSLLIASPAPAYRSKPCAA